MKNLFSAQMKDRLWLSENRRLRTAVIACICLLALNVLILLAVLGPLQARIAEKESRRAELRSRYSAAVLFQKQKKTLGSISEGVLQQKDMPILIKELVQKAKALHLRMEAVNYQIPRPGPAGIATLTFSFPVTGRYADVKRFIYEVETSRRLLGIESVELKAGQGRVDLDMKIITYVRGQEQ